MILVRAYVEVMSRTNVREERQRMDAVLISTRGRSVHHQLRVLNAVMSMRAKLRLGKLR